LGSPMCCEVGNVSQSMKLVSHFQLIASVKMLGALSPFSHVLLVWWLSLGRSAFSVLTGQFMFLSLNCENLFWRSGDSSQSEPSHEHRFYSQGL
jgi:hypothetical protein